MTLKASKRKSSFVAVTIAVIALLTVVLVVGSGVFQSNVKINTQTTIKPEQKNSPPPENVTDTNTKNSSSATNSGSNEISTNINPISSNTNEQQYMTQFLLSTHNTGQSQDLSTYNAFLASQANSAQNTVTLITPTLPRHPA